MTREEVQSVVNAVPFWWHSIDVGHGITTPGATPNAVQQQMLRQMKLPDLRGKSVLDIGAWDGFFSFAAERQNADRVVALDHFVWEHDIRAVIDYKKKGNQEGGPRLEAAAIASFHRPKELPGKAGFDAARRLLNSKVEPVIGDFSTMDLSTLGQFDVVLFLGVLYHLENPLAALRRLRQLARGYALIETEAVYIDHFEHMALCEFFEGTELNNDATNWWAPNERALTGMCRAAGFSNVEVLNERPKLPTRYMRARREAGNLLNVAGLRKANPRRYRLVVRATV